MTTLSITVPNDLASFLEDYVRDGEVENRSQLVRNLLQKFRDEYAIMRILQAEKEVKKYGTLKGDLRTLVKKMK